MFRSTLNASNQVQNEGTGLRLLSLDGGGIKGLSEIDILDQIMRSFAHAEAQRRRLQEEGDHDYEQMNPCKMFDLIGGSGTGGLLAILLHPLNRTLEQAKAEYIKIMTAVFSPSPHPREKRLEKEIKDLCEQVLGDRDASLRCGPNCGSSIKCRTFVLTSPTHNHSHPRIFTTYPTATTTTGVNGGSGKITIWQAVRATMAYPGILNDIIIGGDESLGSEISTSVRDGEMFSAPIRSNNPVSQVLEQAKFIWGSRVRQEEEERKWASILISIGSGVTHPVRLPRGEQEGESLTQALIEIARDCGKAHQDMEKKFTDNNELRIPYIPSQQPSTNRAHKKGRKRKAGEGPIQERFYYRFHVEQGLQDFKEFEFGQLPGSRKAGYEMSGRGGIEPRQHHLGIIVTHTAQYLLNNEQKIKMDQVVDALKRRENVYKIPYCMY